MSKKGERDLGSHTLRKSMVPRARVQLYRAILEACLRPEMNPNDQRTAVDRQPDETEHDVCSRPEMIPAVQGARTARKAALLWG